MLEVLVSHIISPEDSQTVILDTGTQLVATTVRWVYYVFLSSDENGLRI
jgi:hypothetical protein